MAIGSMRHKVIIQTQTSGSTSAGSRGQSQKTWADAKTVQASIVPLSGRELTLARQTIATATHKVEMYYNTSAVVKSRIKFGSRYLNIENVQNIDERKRKLQLLCTEEV